MFARTSMPTLWLCLTRSHLEPILRASSSWPSWPPLHVASGLAWSRIHLIALRALQKGASNERDWCIYGYGVHRSPGMGVTSTRRTVRQRSGALRCSSRTARPHRNARHRHRRPQDRGGHHRRSRITRDVRSNRRTDALEFRPARDHRAWTVHGAVRSTNNCCRSRRCRCSPQLSALDAISAGNVRR